MESSIVLATSVVCKDAYIQRVDSVNGRLVPILTYDTFRAKKFRSFNTASNLACALHRGTMQRFRVIYTD